VSLRALDAHVEVEVADDGRGIATDFLPHVFERFRQADEGSTRAHGGLGIGLTIVKKLVELHGGTIEVAANSDGAGSRFTVTLPRIAAPPLQELQNARSPQEPQEPGSPVAPAIGCHVLLVEDNVDARETTAELLRLEGHEVSEAGDGDEALSAIAQRLPDVVVMDLGLPGKDGFAIAAEIRRTPTLRRLPLIALSGFGQERDRRASAAAGFDDHLVKPVETETLVEAIRKQLARKPA
jgi:CheY-like chemotaxis protein